MLSSFTQKKSPESIFFGLPKYMAYGVIVDWLASKELFFLFVALAHNRGPEGCRAYESSIISNKIREKLLRSMSTRIAQDGLRFQRGINIFFSRFLAESIKIDLLSDRILINSIEENIKANTDLSDDYDDLITTQIRKYQFMQTMNGQRVNFHEKLTGHVIDQVIENEVDIIKFLSQFDVLDFFSEKQISLVLEKIYKILSQAVKSDTCIPDYHKVFSNILPYVRSQEQICKFFNLIMSCYIQTESLSHLRAFSDALSYIDKERRMKMLEDADSPEYVDLLKIMIETSFLSSSSAETEAEKVFTYLQQFFSQEREALVLDLICVLRFQMPYLLKKKFLFFLLDYYEHNQLNNEQKFPWLLIMTIVSHGKEDDAEDKGIHEDYLEESKRLVKVWVDSFKHREQVIFLPKKLQAFIENLSNEEKANLLKNIHQKINKQNNNDKVCWMVEALAFIAESFPQVEINNIFEYFLKEFNASVNSEFYYLAMLLMLTKYINASFLAKIAVLSDGSLLDNVLSVLENNKRQTFSFFEEQIKKICTYINQEFFQNKTILNRLLNILFDIDQCFSNRELALEMIEIFKKFYAIEGSQILESVLNKIVSFMATFNDINLLSPALTFWKGIVLSLPSSLRRIKMENFLNMQLAILNDKNNNDATCQKALEILTSFEELHLFQEQIDGALRYIVNFIALFNKQDVSKENFQHDGGFYSKTYSLIISAVFCLAHLIELLPASSVLMVIEKYQIIDIYFSLMENHLAINVYLYDRFLYRKGYFQDGFLTIHECILLLMKFLIIKDHFSGLKNNDDLIWKIMSQLTNKNGFHSKKIILHIITLLIVRGANLKNNLNKLNSLDIKDSSEATARLLLNLMHSAFNPIGDLTEVNNYDHIFRLPEQAVEGKTEKKLLMGGLFGVSDNALPPSTGISSSIP